MSQGKEPPAPSKDVPPASEAGKKDAAAPKPAEKPPAPAKPKTELELARDEIATLKQQLQKAAAEVADWKEKHVYLQAEFDNSEKRRIKAMDGQRKRMQADIIFAFLPLVDSFLPAVKKFDEGAYKEVKALGEGLKTLKGQLDNILKGLGVTPIDLVNVPFDYNLHEVQLAQERADMPEDIVLAVIQVGWKLGADVIRPAKVIVSKKPAPPVPVNEVDVKDLKACDNASAGDKEKTK